MAITKFLKLVEIQTKAASMIPLLFGTIYAVYRFHVFEPGHFVLMLVSLLSFDMTTTAINNYYDFKKAARKQGYGYEKHNAIVKYNMNPAAVLALIILMFVIAVAAGVMLVLQTGWLLLVLGGLSFAVGILYSFGPIPISRMPLGEIFSGLFMRFVIIFVSAYIHAGDRLAALTLEGGALTLQVHLLETLLVFLISIPAVLGIANIMLANNICDMDEDIDNKRYTLPVYIGKGPALILFKLLYYAAYADVIVLAILGVHPLILLLVLLTVVPVSKNIKTFTAQPTKQFTFGLSVQNFLLTNAARVVALGIAALFPF